MVSSAGSSPVVVMEEGNTMNDGTAMARRVLRKVDLRLIPLLFVTYMFNFMDKTILSSASVFGLIDDTVRFVGPPPLGRDIKLTGRR
jgi:hypothetical protein